MNVTRVVTLVSCLLALFAGCGDDDDDATADAGTDAGPGDAAADAGGDAAVPEFTRLSARGTDIVNDSGETVLLRGFALGGWLFHETWITLFGYSTHGRAYLLAKGTDLEEEVPAAMREIGAGYTPDPVEKSCPGNDPGPDDVNGNGEIWLPRLAEALEKRVGAKRAGEFIEELSAWPSTCDDGDLKLLEVLEERFGTAGRDELLDVFQRAWITEADIEWLAGQGFNLVRIPIGYRSLITNSQLAPLTALDWNEKAFARIDDLLGWCEKHRVYAVIDIQEAPGAQNTYNGPSTLYSDPAMQELTVELWKELSDRYVDRDVVAAYSLLAEPYGSETPEERDRVFDLLVKAIRDNGDDHLLVIHEGSHGIGSLPDPAELGWTNVVYSSHWFQWNLFPMLDTAKWCNLVKGIEGKAHLEAQARHKVPYYIGSFSTVVDDPAAYRASGVWVSLFNNNGWSWSMWTYKRFEDPVTVAIGFEDFEPGAWGIRHTLESEFDRPDPYLDGMDELKRKLAAYRDLEVAPNQPLLDELRNPSHDCR